MELPEGQQELPVQHALTEAIKAAVQETAWLSVQNRNLEDDGIAEICQRLCNYGGLRGLFLRGNGLSDDGTSSVVKALYSHSRLRRLDLAGNSISPLGAAHLGQAFRRLSQLQFLWLSDNRLGDEGVSCVAEGVVGLEQLYELALSNNAVADKGTAKLARILTEGSGIKVLWLDRNRVSDEGAMGLARALAGSHRRGAGTGDAVEDLPQPSRFERHGMVGAAKLETLHLTGNRIGDAGVSDLATALETRGCRLRDLQLSKNRIGNFGAMRFAKTLGVPTALKVLTLCDNKISDIGAQQLVACLARREASEKVNVNISGNPVQHLSPEALENVARSAQTVRDLARIGITLEQLLVFYDTNYGQGHIVPYQSTVSDVTLQLIIPACEDYGLSYAECKNHARTLPEHYVVFAWGGLFYDLVLAVAQHATGHWNPPMDPDANFYDTRQELMNKTYFIAPFCVNQLENNDYNTTYMERPKSQHLPGHPDCQTDKFHLVTEEIAERGGGALATFDESFVTLKRLMCLREVKQCLLAGMQVEVAISCQGHVHKLPRRFRGITAETAEARSEEVRARLLKEVKDLPGGLEAFDQDVCRMLERKLDERYSELVRQVPPEDLVPPSSAASKEAHGENASVLDVDEDPRAALDEHLLAEGLARADVELDDIEAELAADRERLRQLRRDGDGTQDEPGDGGYPS